MDEAAKTRLEAGQEVAGYRVLRLLGKGGMAEVYAVESVKTGAHYALKVFACEQNGALFLKKRFLVEGRLLTRLNHPRLVRVFDFGYLEPDKEETPYFVMDLVTTDLALEAGAAPRPLTLRAALEQNLTDEDRLAGWYGDLVEALAYVHAHAVVHRDISLENVLIGPDGRAVLSDFGVAKVVDRDLRAELNLSLVTMMSDGKPLMGKAFYLAPEVRSGDAETPASDYYALGVMFFYLLSQTWYTPGARMADMLGLFDDRWQEILPALLDADPARRRAPAWKGEPSAVDAPAPAASTAPRRRPSAATFVAWTLVAALALSWGVFGVLRHRLNARVAQFTPVYSANAEDFKAGDVRENAWFARGLVAEAFRSGLSPDRLSHVLGLFECSSNMTAEDCAIEYLRVQTRFLLCVACEDWDGALELWWDIPEAYRSRLLQAVPPARRTIFSGEASSPAEPRISTNRHDNASSQERRLP